MCPCLRFSYIRLALWLASAETCRCVFIRMQWRFQPWPLAAHSSRKPQLCFLTAHLPSDLVSGLSADTETDHCNPGRGRHCAAVSHGECWLCFLCYSAGNRGRSSGMDVPSITAEGRWGHVYAGLSTLRESLRGHVFLLVPLFYFFWAHTLVGLRCER